jgi:hypothetical protein
MVIETVYSSSITIKFFAIGQSLKKMFFASAVNFNNTRAFLHNLILMLSYQRWVYYFSNALPSLSTFQLINLSTKREQAFNTEAGCISLPYTGTGNATGA